MTDINYSELDSYLVKAGQFPVFLLYGEELLYKTALKKITDALIPEPEQDFGVEPVEGDDVYAAIEQVNTYSFTGGAKLVVLTDSKIFLSGKDHGDIIEKAKQAYDSSEVKKAAGLILKLLSLKGIDPESASRKKASWLDSSNAGNGAWIDEIIDYTLKNELKPPSAKDPLVDLQKAVERGFPENHYLAVTAESTHKQRKLYKTIAEKGLVVDCSVASGTRLSDRKAQESVLREQASIILEKTRKKFAPRVFEEVYELTGFHLRTFIGNLEKLVNYVGKRNTITLEDVDAVLSKTREDPVYVLTEAIESRKLEDALASLESLLSAQYFPLQIISAAANRIRRLIVARSFLDSPEGRSFAPNMSYQQFQREVVDHAAAFDKKVETALSEWADDSDTETSKKVKSNRKTIKTPDELILAKSPKNAYPVFMTLKKAAAFTEEELLSAVLALNQADMQLKRSAHDPKMILENVIFTICRNTGFN